MVAGQEGPQEKQQPCSTKNTVWTVTMPLLSLAQLLTLGFPLSSPPWICALEAVCVSRIPLQWSQRAEGVVGTDCLPEWELLGAGARDRFRLTGGSSSFRRYVQARASPLGEAEMTDGLAEARGASWAPGSMAPADPFTAGTLVRGWSWSHPWRTAAASSF